MPTFSYKCNNCGSLFELILKINENDVPTTEPCPYCKQLSVSQTISFAPPLADPYSLGRYHQSDEWRGILKGIKNKNPGSNININ